MRALRRLHRDVAAIVLSLAILSCRDTGGPAGTGRIAPTSAGLAVAPLLDAEPGDPVIPIRQARVRLFRLPAQTPEQAILDTIVPFLETEEDRALTLDVVLTMVNERFGMELALLDDRAQVVYLGRDTVIAYTSGPPPAAKPLRMRYAGPDTGVARITLAPRDTVFAIGDALPLRVGAFLPDGRPTSARFGFAVHGASAISVHRSARSGALHHTDADERSHHRRPVGRAGGRRARFGRRAARRARARVEQLGCERRARDRRHGDGRRRRKRDDHGCLGAGQGVGGIHGISRRRRARDDRAAHSLAAG